MQEIVARLAVAHRVDIDEDQPLHRVGDDGIVIDRRERLLLVRGPHRRRVAQRRDRLVGGQRHAGRVGGGDMRVLAERREGRGDDLLGDPLVGDRGDIVDAEAALALGDVEILAAHLHAPRRAAGVLGDVAERLDRIGLARDPLVERPAAIPVLQLAAVALDMRFEEVGIGIAVEIRSDHRLRLGPFGHAHRLDALLQPRPTRSCRRS